MPQNVPMWDLSERALQLRAFVYEHWGRTGVGPTLREVHEALGFERRQAIRAYKELGLATYCVVDGDTQNCNLLKFQPYSAFPSQVQAFLDDELFCFVGCAMESTAFSKMPEHKGRRFRMESWCACCLTPISFAASEGELSGYAPSEPLIHVSLPVWDWNNVDITLMCDSMNFVLDAEHAERYERQVGRRGVLFTMAQALLFTKGTADTRGYDYHRPPDIVNPAMILKGIQMLGIDTSNWG
jgi:hypothetical protein